MGKQFPQLPNATGLDYFVKANGMLDMEFANEPRGLFGKGDVDLAAAELALTTFLAQEDIRQAMSLAGLQLEYIEDAPDQGG